MSRDLTRIIYRSCAAAELGRAALWHGFGLRCGMGLFDQKISQSLQCIVHAQQLPALKTRHRA